MVNKQIMYSYTSEDTLEDTMKYTKARISDASTESPRIRAQPESYQSHPDPVLIFYWKM